MATPPDVITSLNATLDRFDPITLAEMQEVKLLDRLDTKFTFRQDQLPALLDEMAAHYRLLEISGARTHRYETLYFDTDRLDLYARHHSGKYSRHKIRYRRYAGSGLCFFEVKTKNNKGRTVKQRIERPEIPGAITGEDGALLERETPLKVGAFKPVMWVHFTRLTFVSKTAPERLTLDLDLSYQSESLQAGFPRLTIAEVKRDKFSSDSPFVRMMRARRIWQGSMSKYCFGIINLYPHVKMNRFKERMKQLKLVAA